VSSEISYTKNVGSECGKWANVCCAGENPCENLVLSCNTGVCCPADWLKIDSSGVCCDKKNPEHCAGSIQIFFSKQYSSIQKTLGRTGVTREDPI